MRLVFVGLLAIAISGAVCGLIGWSFGRASVAGDTLSARITIARCHQLIESQGGATGIPVAPVDTEIKNEGQCRLAELADHADEVVIFRLMMIIPAGIVSLGYLFLEGRWRRYAEPKASMRLEQYLGLAAFGLATIVLLGIAATRGVQGNADGLGRWLSDGSVAAAFCLAYATWLYRTSRRPSAA